MQQHLLSFSNSKRSVTIQNQLIITFIRYVSQLRTQINRSDFNDAEDVHLFIFILVKENSKVRIEYNIRSNVYIKQKFYFYSHPQLLVIRPKTKFTCISNTIKTLIFELFLHLGISSAPFAHSLSILVKVHLARLMQFRIHRKHWWYVVDSHEQ